MKRRQHWFFLLLGTLLAGSAVQSCAPVKEYQKEYLNDGEMDLSARKSEKFEGKFQTYREGTSGANGGQTGGGCSCN